MVLSYLGKTVKNESKTVLFYYNAVSRDFFTSNTYQWKVFLTVLWEGLFSK